MDIEEEFDKLTKLQIPLEILLDQINLFIDLVTKKIEAKEIEIYKLQNYL